MSDSVTEKAELARANTMQVTAKEGEAFLDKNLTEWKKPALMEHFEEGKDGAASTDEHNGDSSKLPKYSTMVGTAEEGKALLGGEVLGDTRQETKKRQSREKSSTKRSSTIDKVLQEAKAVYTDLDTSSEGRSLRKRAPPPAAKEATPPVKRASTMARTAKEGEEFVKRGKGKSPKKGAKKGDSDDKEDDVDNKADGEKVTEDAPAETNDKAAAAPKVDSTSAADGTSAATEEKAADGKHEENATSDSKPHDGEHAAASAAKEGAASIADDRGGAAAKDSTNNDGAAAHEST